MYGKKGKEGDQSDDWEDESARKDNIKASVLTVFWIFEEGMRLKAEQKGKVGEHGQKEGRQSHKGAYTLHLQIW